MTNYAVHRLADTAVRSRRRFMEDFVRLPRTIYAEDPNWIEPLRSEILRTLDDARNPYFHFARRELLICYDGNIPIARMIVSMDPTYSDPRLRTTAFFGYFECLPDREACTRIVAVAAEIARGWGATELEGPFNPHYYSELGIKLDRFDEAPHFFETHNPAYYPALLRDAGFELRTTLRTLALNDGLPDPIQRRYGSQQSQNHGRFTVRQLSRRHLTRDLEAIRTIYNDAFAENPYFHAVSRAEYRFSAKYLRYVTEPEFTTIVEDDYRPIAVVQVMQDVNPLLQDCHGSIGPFGLLRYQRRRRHLKAAVVYAVGIRSAYQRSSVLGVLLRGIVPVLMKFDHVTTTWTSENNGDLHSFCSRLGFTPDRSFAIFGRPLTTPEEVRHA